MTRIQVAAFVALLVAGGVGAAQAQQRAYSVPTSNNIVKLEVKVPSGRWIKVMVLEGDQARIDDQGVAMAFVPVTHDGGVRIRAFRIEKHADGSESMHFVENMDARTGDTAYTKKAAADFGVKVVRVMSPPVEGERSPRPAQ